jgi:antitoxin component of MazEF toxin-antitoxin module
MIFERKLIKFGDSSGIVIPKDALLFLGWNSGEDVLINIDEIGQIVLKKKDD